MARFITVLVYLLLAYHVVDGHKNDLVFEMGGAKDTDAGGGMLQVQESESRQIQYLDGMWNFRADQSSNRSQGMDESWYAKRLDKASMNMAGLSIAVYATLWLCNINRYGWLS